MKQASAFDTVNAREKYVYQSIDKNKVATGFDKAAPQYNANANIQSEIAHYALTYLEGMTEKHVGSLLDVGCGTANACSRLQHIARRIVGVDISLNMLREASSSKSDARVASFNGINADAEKLPIRTQSIDTVYSSMALQWCQSPEQVLREVKRVLKPDGKALLCVLVGESFAELQQGWSSLGLPSRLNQFHSSESWLDASKQPNWSVKSHSKTFTSYHKSVLEMLGSIKRIGANTRLKSSSNKASINELNVKQPYIGKQEIRALSDYLKGQRTNASLLPLSYRLLFLELKNS